MKSARRAGRDAANVDIHNIHVVVSARPRRGLTRELLVTVVMSVMFARSTGGRTPHNRRYRLVRRTCPRSKIRAMARWLALIAITQQVSCSGGKGAGSTNTNADPFPAVTVSVSPGSSRISAGGSVQFIATVQNASNPAVRWQVNGIPSGNSSVGTIAPAGAGTATYMAPASVSRALTVTVTAVSQADTTKTGSATVTINPPPNAQITVSPANPEIVTGASLQFSASVQNGPQAVIWEVDGIQLGNSTVGFISSSGFYTAPATIPSFPTVTIAAILQTDSSVSGGTKATVVAPVPSVGISPSTANVAIGNALQLTATVENSSAAVNWAVSASVADPGTITSTGPYTASFVPANVPTPLPVTVTATLANNASVSASSFLTIVSASAFTGVYSWRNDDALTGQNPQETRLQPSNVNSSQFGKLFGCAVDGAIFAQPLYVANVAIPSQGTRNVVYVATEHDSVYALDADASSCQILWQASFIDLAGGVTTVRADDPSLSGQMDIVPEIGITGTPVIDPNTATLYVVAKTEENSTCVQRLHALDLTTGWVGGVAGAEKSNGPAIIAASVSGTGDGSQQSGQIPFDPLKENQRSALLLAGGNIYIAFDSYDDTDPFHGWLFAYNAGDLQTAPAVFMSTPNGSRGGIGESGAAPSADAGGNVFAVTSDGTAGPGTIGNYPDTLLKLQINTPGALSVADTFARPNETILNRTQKFFGSTGVLLLPDSAGTTSHPHLAIAGDEAGNLYLLDRDNLRSDGAMQTLCVGTPLTGTPAYWVSNNVPTIYVAAAGDSLKAFPLANGAFSSVPCPSPAAPSSQSSETFNTFGASPVISSNGSSSGIAWALDTTGYATSGAAVLRAYDATNLTTRLYESPSSGSGAAGLAVKFAVPTVANGKVYVGTGGTPGGAQPQGELSVFGLLP